MINSISVRSSMFSRQYKQQYVLKAEQETGQETRLFTDCVSHTKINCKDAKQMKDLGKQ